MNTTTIKRLFLIILSVFTLSIVVLFTATGIVQTIGMYSGDSFKNNKIRYISQRNETYYKSKGYQVFSEYQFAVKCPAILKEVSRQSNDNFDFNYEGSNDDTFYQIMIIRIPDGTRDMSKNEYREFLQNMFGNKGGGKHVLWGEENLPAYLLDDYVQDGYKGRGIAVERNGRVYAINILTNSNLKAKFNGFTNNFQFF